MRWVAAKAEDRQAMLSSHRMRALPVKFHTTQANQLCGLLYEFGATFRAGRVAGLTEVRARMVEPEDTLPGACYKEEAACRVIAEVSGIGRLTATALVATMGTPGRSSRGVSSLRFRGWCHRNAGRTARSFFYFRPAGASTLTVFLR